MHFTIDKDYRGEKFSFPVETGDVVKKAKAFGYYDASRNTVVVDHGLGTNLYLSAKVLAHEFHHAMVFTGTSEELRGIRSRTVEIEIRAMKRLTVWISMVVLAAIVGASTRNEMVLVGMFAIIIPGVFVIFAARRMWLTANEVLEAYACQYADDNWEEFIGFAQLFQFVTAPAGATFTAP